jgi:hypothetical protein
MFSAHQLQSRSHTYRSVMEENTHHTAFTAVDKRGGEVQVSFCLTRSTNMGYPRTKLKVFQQEWMSFNAKTFVHYLLSLFPVHCLTKTTGLKDTCLQVKIYPLCTHQVSEGTLSFSRSY